MVILFRAEFIEIGVLPGLGAFCHSEGFFAVELRARAGPAT